MHMASVTWTKLYAGAKAAGHPDPERFATTSFKNRERSIELKAQRRKMIVTDHIPKKTEMATAVPDVKKIFNGKQCRAQTLEGKQCKFKATCGEFCKKHCASIVQPQWQKIDENKLKDTVTFKGYVCSSREQARKVFGEPNGLCDDKVDLAWCLDFAGLHVRTYFCKERPEMNVCGSSVEAIVKVRMALAL